MNKLMSRLFRCLVAGLLSSTVGCASAATPSRSGGSIEFIDLDVGGVERNFILYSPDRENPKALLIVLHGGMGEPERMRRLGFEPLADRDNFLVVYPRGKGKGWNDGRNSEYIAQRSEQADDVAFIRAIVSSLAHSHAAPMDAVFVTGVSNGGMMSLRLVCESADILAGVSATIALLPEALEKSCNPARAIPLQIVVGTDDRLVPYAGGEVAAFGKARRGKVLSADATMDIFQRRFECTGEVANEHLDDADPNDGTQIVRRRYVGCADDTPLEMLVINGGGHRWPGSERAGGSNRLGRLTGNTTRDIDGAEVVWTFLKNGRDSR